MPHRALWHEIQQILLDYTPMVDIIGLNMRIDIYVYDIDFYGTPTTIFFRHDKK